MLKSSRSVGEGEYWALTTFFTICWCVGWLRVVIPWTERSTASIWAVILASVLGLTVGFSLIQLMWFSQASTLNKLLSSPALRESWETIVVWLSGLGILLTG